MQSKYKKKSVDLFSSLGDDIAATVREAVNESITAGLHVKDSALEVSKRLSALGINPAKPHALETIFRTQTQLAYSAGRWQNDQDPDVADLIWGYEYVTVGDDRVREMHKKLEGVRLAKDDAFWKKFWPPNGWNCRCQAIPILEKVRPKKPPKDAKPDKGFDYNAGMVFKGKVEAHATTSKSGSYGQEKRTPFAAVGQRIKQLIAEGLSNARIVATVKQEYPDSSVSSSSVSFYRLEMKK